MSIPTSLIFVVLIGAWLAVLVPMVARRREQVPETEVAGGSFRVLRRASASLRRRPKFSGQGDLNANDLDDDIQGPLSMDEHDALEEELLDGESEFDDDLTDAELEQAEINESSAAQRSRFGPVTPAGLSYQDDDVSAADEQHAPVDPIRRVSQSQLRPVPRRQGRGGYDPDAAEAARAYRYSRRRRVTVILLLATVAFSAAAYVFTPMLWSGTGVSGLLLVSYLGYLRRQVHIETDIQQRRLARLRRARQIRPEYRGDVADGPVVGSSFTSGEIAVSQVPPSGYRRGREIVDLEDDDPSFDDLDYYQPVAYRKASGQ